MPTPVDTANFSSLNSLLRKITNGEVSPIRARLHKPIDDVSDTTRRYYKGKSKQVVQTVLECIAPGQSQCLFNEIMRSHFAISHSSSAADKVLVSKLVLLYSQTESWYSKRQILSLFAQDHTKEELRSMISGLTVWRIDQAREHAKTAGPGKPVDLEPIQRTRLPPASIDHFLDFISSPAYLQDVSFGTKYMKLTNGEILEIPNVVRTVISSRLIGLYQSYCEETGFKPLGRATLYKILEVSR